MMRGRAWKFVVFALAAVLGGTFLLAQTRQSTQTPQPQPPQSAAVQRTGRFEIVNGTPDMARNIMLLDTWTGDSWEKCSSTDNDDGWCPLPQFSGTAASSSK
jgi:hypothetical protein